MQESDASTEAIGTPLVRQEQVQEVVESPQLLDKVINQQEVREIYQQRIHAGPLPTPEDLVKYGETIPNAGERMMAIVEQRLQMDQKEQDFRHRSEQLQHSDAVKIYSRGQNYAMISIILITAFSCWLVYLSYVLAAVFTMTSLIGVVAGIFVFDRINNKRNEQENREELQPEQSYSEE